MRVQFVIAGVQKAGTTALDHFLRAHPTLCLPKRKEVHFFDDDRLDWRRPDYRRYHDFFTPQAGQMCGEATPIYSYWAPSLSRIRVYNPQMKIIVCLRDPVARAWSHWEMEVSRGAERQTFSSAVGPGQQRVRSGPGSQWGCHRTYSYVERGLYAPQIQQMLALFPREQLLFIEQAALRDDHQGSLDRVCDFLGVARFATYPTPQLIRPLPKRTDLGTIPPPIAQALARFFAADTLQTEQRTGLDLRHWASHPTRISAH